MPTTPLTEKQQRFCEEFVKDLHPFQAALRAGYSKKAARASAFENLSNKAILELLCQLQQDSQRSQLKAEAVIAELKHIAFANMDDYIKAGAEQMELADYESLSREQKAAIAELSEETTRTGLVRKCKLYDKLRALDLLGKHFGIYERDSAPQPAVITRQLVFQVVPIGKGEA